MYIPFPSFLFKVFQSRLFGNSAHCIGKNTEQNDRKWNFQIEGGKGAIAPPRASYPKRITIEDEKDADNCRTSVDSSHACAKQHRGIAFDRTRSLWTGPEEHGRAGQRGQPVSQYTYDRRSGQHGCQATALRNLSGPDSGAGIRSSFRVDGNTFRCPLIPNNSAEN